MSLSWSDLSLFNRDLAGAVDAGVPLGPAIGAAARDLGKPSAREALEAVRREVEAGTPLHDALAKRPADFPAAYVALVRAGAEGGNLAEVLRREADDAEFHGRFRRDLLGAALYPLFILLGCFVFLVLIRFVALGGMMDDASVLESTAFTDPKTGKPLHSPGIRVAALAAHRNTFLVLCALAAVFAAGLAAVMLFPRLAGFRLALWRIGLIVPVFCRFLKAGLASSFLQALHGAVRAGIPLPRALEMAREALQGTPAEAEAAAVGKRVAEGASLSGAIGEPRAFPAGLSSLLAAGEVSGGLAETLGALARLYRERWEAGMAFLKSVLLPAFQIAAGLAVFAVLFGLFSVYFMTLNVISKIMF
ncbi:MAG: type II secretion system F family protein [Planctomycetes bacterium]|nr:type II secretion system F family protein [Planctomycetota bacterium]MCU0727930.1 type II secretion system F family protein [Planctomycetota bacterium]